MRSRSFSKCTFDFLCLKNYCLSPIKFVTMTFPVRVERLWEKYALSLVALFIAVYVLMPMVISSRISVNCHPVTGRLHVGHCRPLLSSGLTGFAQDPLTVLGGTGSPLILKKDACPGHLSLHCRASGRRGVERKEERVCFCVCVRVGPPTRRIQRHRIHSPFCWPATPPQLWARPSPIVPPANMKRGGEGGLDKGGVWRGEWMSCKQWVELLSFSAQKGWIVSDWSTF